MSVCFALFDTDLGSGAIAWSEHGVIGIQLPEPDAVRLRARMRRHFPQASQSASPPPEIRDAIEGIAALLRGEQRDLTDVELVMHAVPPFHLARDVAQPL